MTTVAYGYPIPLVVVLESGANNKVIKANVINSVTADSIHDNLPLTYVAGSTGRYAYAGTPVTMPAVSVLIQYKVYESDGTTLIQEAGETIDVLPGSAPGSEPLNKYVTLSQVMMRLEGKVRFTEDVLDEGRMYNGLAEALIDEAEGQVELDLSERYYAPFQPTGGGTFADLPDRPTKQVLSSLCLAQAVMKILDTDFGMGGSIDSSKYYEAIQKRYKTMLRQIVAKRDGVGSGWKYPPLPGLKLNYQNAAADDGFAGAVLVAGGSDSGSYPADQVNNPALNFGSPWDDD